MPLPGLRFRRVLGVLKEGSGLCMLCDEEQSPGEPEKQAVLSLWQQPWKVEDGGALFEDLPSFLSSAVTNDQHTRGVVSVTARVDARLHRRVTSEEVARYTPSPRVELRETAAMYAEVTLPWVLETQADRQNWMLNCLTNGAEEDKVLYDDKHVMLLPDFKWDGEDPAQVYVLALFKDLTLRSVRDFGREHVEMLDRVRAVAADLFQTRWGLHPSKFRAYFHYHPNYWLVHLHLVALSSTKLTGGILLDDVIEHLKADADYYRTATLTVNLAEGSPLHARAVEFLSKS